MSSVPQYTLRRDQRAEVQRILQVVAAFFRLNVSDLTGKRRFASFVWARHCAMYLVRKRLALSLPQIGGQFGGRDHTSVIHAVGRVEAQLAEDTLVWGPNTASHKQLALLEELIDNAPVAVTAPFLRLV